MKRSTPTPAGSATQGSKGDRTRQRILDAAAAEVASRGVAGTSINSIAAAAGLKTGSIYFHFESKDKLVEEMFEEGLRTSLSRLENALAALPVDADPGERLKTAIGIHVGAVRDMRDYTVAVLGSSFPKNAAGAAARQLRQAYVTRWTELVGDAQLAGKIVDGPNPALLREAILGTINALSLSGRSLEEVLEALQALFGDAPG